MRPQDIIERLHSTPFRPFRLRLSDGNHFDIGHPELVMVFQHKVIVALGGNEDRGFERDVHCSLLHITAIEELAAV